MRSATFMLTAITTLLLSGGLAHADYTFQFADSTGTSNGLHTLGLINAGVQLNTQTPTVANVTSVATNPAFDPPQPGQTGIGANAFLTESAVTNPPVVSPNSDPNRILLGTFTFTGITVGSTPATTSFPTNSGADNVLADGTAIDSFIGQSTLAIQVTAVPEPGTILLTGLGASAIAFGAWRRRVARLAKS
jgi:PEP-CTERM motif